MAPSRNSLWLFCLVLAPLAALADATAGPAGGTTTTPRTARAAAEPLLINPKEPYQFDAATCDTDYKTQVMACRSVVLSQGSTRVRADQAHFACSGRPSLRNAVAAINCVDSHWTLQGNVRIDAPPRGDLRSDQATVEVRDNRIVRATVTGKPAEFEQQLADDLGMEKGHADQIVYDVEAGTVLLTNDAWVSKGGDEMSAPSIAYSIREQKVLATSGGTSQGVHITITPQSLQKQGSPQKRKGAAGPRTSSTPPPQGHNSAPPGPLSRSRGGRYALDALLPAIHS